MYADRQDAGHKLGQALERWRGKDAVVLALPRGGVVLGAKVAEALHAPLDVVLVRKIGHPFNPEYAIGAVVLGEEPIYNEDEIADESWLKRAVAAEQRVNEKRRELYYGDQVAPLPLKGKTAVIVDDGIATGLTMEAAFRAARRQQPKRIVVAVPVAPPDSIRMLNDLADEVIVLDDPDGFLGAVGAHYREFAQVDDDEVRLLLGQQRKKQNGAGNRDT